MAPIVPFIPLIAAGIGAATAVGTVAYTASQGKGDSGGGGGAAALPTVQEPLPAPTEDTGAVQDAERRQRIAAAGAQGRSSTILTGGLGLQDKAPVAKKELFGEA